ncbi:metallophosphoesterase [Roseisolibacter agri]|uniref:Calcineurin-like phosphoesterase domain-containing protein n=1 Tax=Roseisolibacter agri TaxID=2014610 RepID=A0AA37QHW7_9BACT|nr:metallophosphoesterase [Roseisolibacter agri]GLC26790.1 hypothetical protein rosag_33030 [Roseisolibacter agri]
MRTPRRVASLALLLLAPTAPAGLLSQTPRAAAAAVRGVVFVDANGDGVRGPREQGLAGVAVSNQDAVVVTDASGAFALPGAGRGVAFVSVPDGYRSVGRFWRALHDTTTALTFALAPVPRARTFTFVHASDPHVAPAVVARTQRLRALVDSLRPAFALVTGDLVRDALRVPEAEARGYYELWTREAAAFATPLWTVPGNHEVFGIERDKSGVDASHPLYGHRMYRHYLGPEHYSFTYGGVHFVGLNTVDVADQWYYGHVDSLQLAWLERDLALVPPDMPVVTFDHIPLLSASEILHGYTDRPPAPSLITVGGRTVFRHTVSNAGDVLALLRRRRHVLALGGHIHHAERISHEVEGLRTRFEQSAAVVGSVAVRGLRFPSGITVYTVRDGVVDAGRFVPLGLPEPPRP